MKVRSGFVSNSSSSSFIVAKAYLSADQLSAIRDHCKSTMFSGSDPHDAWIISEDDYTIEGSCSMDNFDMHGYLEVLGVNMSKVKWGY